MPVELTLCATKAPEISVALRPGERAMVARESLKSLQTLAERFPSVCRQSSGLLLAIWFRLSVHNGLATGCCCCRSSWCFVSGQEVAKKWAKRRAGAHSPMV